MNYPYEIHYKDIRNAYARVNRKWVVVFTISKRKEWDEKFLNEFLKRWESLYEKYAKQDKIWAMSNGWVLIFWERINWPDFFGSDKEFSSTTKEKKLKAILAEYSKDWLDRFSAELWTPYKSMTIRKMKARRGSCSSRQDIVLNSQLVHLPQKYIQYVCAHECAHLVQKNHSAEFRAVVEFLYPKYKEVRKEMKKFILE